jgi:hypothetical protein
MFGFIRKAFRPIARIGEKMSEIFSIGRKSHLGSDIKNLEAFEDLAPSGLRSRFPKGEIRTPEGGFYGDMNSYLKSNPYPK